MKIDLKKSGGDFSSVNSFPPKQTSFLLDLSVLSILGFTLEPDWAKIKQIVWVLQLSVDKPKWPIPGCTKQRTTAILLSWSSCAAVVLIMIKMYQHSFSSFFLLI
jgi:hypothetical protein